jgi:hypothetical protein
MAEFKYVPGETDLYSLPNEILVMLLMRIEQDTIAHFREHDEELRKLRYQVKFCGCHDDREVAFCNIEDCTALGYIFECGEIDHLTKCDICKKTVCNYHSIICECDKFSEYRTAQYPYCVIICVDCEKSIDSQHKGQE